MKCTKSKINSAGYEREVCEMVLMIIMMIMMLVVIMTMMMGS